ncbi:histidine phosphatase family protein [Maricaulis sp.]|uniref:histidine phosphatase family protein n=1 Tax=unclassified Maricaulis TaxID=2632371 RepID=UPI001B215BC0|nr:histidine phosphatase family protein [Maricaulis sp.]MBO6796137.1 histidine phosphatase family protein [Maricaulis sp.]
MSKILLARHGNTFGPGDKVVWVGAKEDLPLVEKGEQQAAALGEALRDAGLTPAHIICGPLKRTRRAAEIVSELTGFDGEVRIDERLREIDYGSWGGKSCDEIIAEFGAKAREEWDLHHRRPPGADWSPSEDTLRSNALASMAAAAELDGLTVVITSNGILRYMYNALTGPDADVKVKTGNTCAVDISGDGGSRLFWNEKPNADLIRSALG